jgi:hypothetical protein
MTQLRMHAESVPDLMSPYIGDFGHRTIFKHYRQITEALRRLQTADEESGPATSLKTSTIKDGPH